MDGYELVRKQPQQDEEIKNKLSLTGGTITGNLKVNGIIKGMNNITLERTVTNVPQDGHGDITADILKFGDCVIASQDNGVVSFNRIDSTRGWIQVYFANRICLARGEIQTPYDQSVDPITTDYLRIGGGIMAGVDSGNFHFMTIGAQPVTLYCKDVSTVLPYSNNPITYSNNNIFDEINSIEVIETENGLGLINPTKTLENNKSIEDEKSLIFTTIDEETGDLRTHMNQNSVIAMMWKANQELIKENESLKSDIKLIKEKLAI